MCWVSADRVIHLFRGSWRGYHSSTILQVYVRYFFKETLLLAGLGVEIHKYWSRRPSGSKWIQESNYSLRCISYIWPWFTPGHYILLNHLLLSHENNHSPLESHCVLFLCDFSFLKLLFTNLKTMCLQAPDCLLTCEWGLGSGRSDSYRIHYLPTLWSAMYTIRQLEVTV